MELNQEARELLIRIDERTSHIATRQDEILDRFESHELQDREDFRTVFERLNKVEKRQNWIMGVGSGLMVAGGLIGAWLKTKLGL